MSFNLGPAFSPFSLLLTLAAVACSAGGTESGPPSPSPYEGTWSSKQAVLTVKDGRVVYFELRQVSCAAVNPDPACQASLALPLNVDASIEEGGFSFKQPVLEVAGRFEADRVQGSYVFHHPAGCCDLTDGRWWAIPPTDPSGSCADAVSSGPAADAIQLGLKDESEVFAPLADGTELDVVMGFQGFRMVVISLLERGLPLEGQTIHVQLTGRQSGALWADYRLTHVLGDAQADGSVLIPDLSVVITASPGDFVDQEAQLTAQATDACGVVFRATPVNVVLRKRF